VPPILADNAFARATVTNFFFFLSLNGFILLPLYIRDLGGTEVEIGVVMGLFNAVGIVCQPLIGPWIDAVGRRPFMLLGVGLSFVSALAAVTMPGIPALAVVRVLQGLGFSAFFVANYAYIADLVPPARRGWALGIFGVSGLLATALAPLLSEWVIRRWGFQWLFAFAAVLALLAGVLVWRTAEAPRLAAPAVGASLWERGGFDEIFRRHMALALFFGLGSGTMFVFLPTFAEALGVRTLGLFYTAYAAAAMGVRIAGGGLIDTRGRRAVIVPSMFLQAAATAGLAALAFLVTRTSATPVVPALFFVGLLSGGAHGFIYPALGALVIDETPEARRGVVVGLFSAMFLIGQTSGSVAFGYVTHALGYGLMWTALALILLVGALASLGLREARPSG
jgi:MFS family permease